MKIQLTFILILLWSLGIAQKIMPFDEGMLEQTTDFWTDDYGGFYFLDSQKLSFSKYDSLGHKNGELLWAVPFRVETVSNPLTIPLFSENAQQIRFVDNNLNYIQDPIDLTSDFSHAKAINIEDLRYMWVLDDVQKQLIKYDYRAKKVIKSFVFNEDFSHLIDVVVDQNLVYFYKEGIFEVYDLNQNCLFKVDLKDIKKMDREGNQIVLFGANKILNYNRKDGLKSIFDIPEARLVGANFKNRFAIIGNNLYLYPLKKDK